MAIIPALDNSDERFVHASSKGLVVVLNDISSVDQADQAVLDMVINTSDNDVLSSSPSCRCGECTGVDRLGDICYECLTPVKESTNISLTEEVWIRAPKGVHSLINLGFLAALISEFTKSKNKEQDLVSWVLNSESRPVKKTLEMERWTNEYKLGRGLNYFIENFELCMTILYELHGKNYARSAMKQMVEAYKDVIFPKIIPLLGKSFVIVEKNATGSYTGQGISLIVDTINLMRGIDADISLTRMSPRSVDSRAARALLNLTYYRLDNMLVDMFKKKSLVRQHVFGTRSNFTIRCVVTSVTDIHDYDVVMIPWGASIAMLRLHLSNLLMKKGYNPIECNDLINSSIHSYNQVINDCLDELIDLCPEKYLDILMLRNPTLGAGSVQRLKALIKRNPKDYTISHPIMDVRLFNLDFDGDECPISLVLDDVMREQTEILKPHYAYLKVSVYGQVSNAFDMPKPIAAMVHNYFKDQVDEPMDSEVLSLLQH